MQYSLASDSWDNKEVEALQKVIKSGRYTMGSCVSTFEEEFSNYFDTKYSVMVNSGSSANLLILATLAEKYKLKGNIIVPVISWSTTFFPIHQYGFEMNFVDVNKYTLNIDVDQIENAINSSTVAIFAVNLLGNSCDYIRLKEIANKHNLILIEDNCESFGSFSNTNEHCGTIGQFGSFSFFFSHHIQTMEGGMITCKNHDDYDYLKSLRAHGWCRDISDNSKLYQKTGNAFKDSFTFITPGYSVRPLEMSGAVGSVQLKKWESLKKGRINNAKYFVKKFSDLPVLIQTEIGNSTWFGFSIIFNDVLEGKRDYMVQKFMENGIECRPIVAGNFLNNPVMKTHSISYQKNGTYPNATYIDDNGLFIGNDFRDLRTNIDLVYKVIKKEI